MLAKLLYLRPGELRRLWPFFTLYFLLFSALSLADGLALALFLQNVGPAHLPGSYGLVAVVNFVLLGAYLLAAERLGGTRVFLLILAAGMAPFALAYFSPARFGGWGGWYQALFVGREVTFTLVILHFGTYLQNYFTRDEHNRVLPLVYSGGRCGGIVGGVLLERLSAHWGLVNLIPVFLGIGAAAALTILAISRRVPPVRAPEDEHGDPGVAGAAGGAAEREARESLAGFLRFTWASPLLFWVTVTTVLFMACRWVLNFQYSSFFAGHFADGAELAGFLGRYTQLALAVSLVVQVLLVNRLIAWVGLKGTHFLYSVLVVGTLALNLLPMTLGLAVFARLVETELRFGLRNPVAQLITNKFSRPLRVRVRAWSLGFLIPTSTLGTSLALGLLVGGGWVAWVSWLGAFLGLVFFAASFGLYGSFAEKGRWNYFRLKGPRMGNLSLSPRAPRNRPPAAILSK